MQLWQRDENNVCYVTLKVTASFPSFAAEMNFMYIPHDPSSLVLTGGCCSPHSALLLAGGHNRFPGGSTDICRFGLQMSLRNVGH